MDFWVLVGLHQHLNGPHAWLFRCCSLFKNRTMGCGNVIISINAVAR